MFIPSCGKLSRFMSRYEKNLKSHGYGENKLGTLNNVYYDNYDLHLLLNLLANSSGVAPAVAAIAQFDKVGSKHLVDWFLILSIQSFYNALKPKFVGKPTFVEGDLKIEFQVKI